MPYDVIVKNGLYFDGTGAPGAVANLGIRGGRVVVAGEATLDEAGCGRVIDARGRWVMPGFVDIHTHYDAEVLAAPALSESVRHGVTTVTVGSCSISVILSETEDCSDLFTRVESVPREHVLPLLREKKTWRETGEYVDFLRGHPLGPNLVSFLGHSDLRTRVMGLERAVDPDARPSEAELAEMGRLLEDALDHGLLGLSTMTNPWDKLDGDRFRSAQLPSTYATWKEYRRLHEVLRRRGRILQSAPSLVNKLNALLFMLESASLFFRRALKTTLITLADAKSSPSGLHRVLGKVTQWVNRVLGGDFRWQTLPVPFEVYADGIDLVVFEEFGAGQAALHLADEVSRNALLRDEKYRRAFRKDYDKRWTPRVWQRDFHDAHIVGCPDPTVVGKSFGEVADARGHPPGRRVPRSRRRPRQGLALAYGHREPPPGRGRAPRERAGRPHRLRRLRRAHPQHGLLQRPAAHAALRARPGPRRSARDAHREGHLATHGRDRRVARHRGWTPAGRRPRRLGRRRSRAARRAARRLPRSEDGGLR